VRIQVDYVLGTKLDTETTAFAFLSINNNLEHFL
ncbi:hypothetical protein LCGC14_2331560, partial [marine sediment metagenome]